MTKGRFTRFFGMGPMAPCCSIQQINVWPSPTVSVFRHLSLLLTCRLTLLFLEQNCVSQLAVTQFTSASNPVHFMTCCLKLEQY